MTTKDYKTLQNFDMTELSVTQQNAIDLVMSGLTDAETAEQVGVHRVTVTNWRLYHPAFRAVLSRRRAQIWEASVDRLRMLVPKAIKALDAGLTQEKTALAAASQVIRLAGLNEEPPPSEPQEPGDFFDQMVEAKMKSLEAERCRRLSPAQQKIRAEQGPPAEDVAADAEAARRAALEFLSEHVKG